MKKALSIKRIKQSFSHAIDGFIVTIKEEPNMILHLIMAGLVVVAGILFKVSYIEWLFLIIMILFVIASEVINTSIENFVDLITDKFDIHAKKSKDMAAAYVMLMSIAAAIIGLVIFVPKIIDLIGR